MPTSRPKGLHGFRGLFTLCTLGATLCTVARAEGTKPTRLVVPDSMLSLREIYPDLAPLPGSTAVGHEFPRRGGGVGSEDPVSAGLTTGHRLPLTNALQRLNEFRSRNGVRLLTLWKSATGTIALHAGKHGTASLQWTSGTLNRGEGSRGVFDQLFSGPTAANPSSPTRGPAGAD